MPIVRLTHNISSALHIGLNIVERVQTLLVVLHIVCVYYTTDVMDDISLLVSLSPNPNPAERLQEKGSNGKRFDFFFIRTFFRSILFPDPDGGPRFRLCAWVKLCSAPIRNSGIFWHMSLQCLL